MQYGLCVRINNNFVVLVMSNLLTTFAQQVISTGALYERLLTNEIFNRTKFAFGFFIIYSIYVKFPIPSFYIRKWIKLDRLLVGGMCWRDETKSYSLPKVPPITNQRQNYINILLNGWLRCLQAPSSNMFAKFVLFSR